MKHSARTEKGSSLTSTCQCIEPIKTPSSMAMPAKTADLYCFYLKNKVARNKRHAFWAKLGVVLRGPPRHHGRGHECAGS